jgi:spermidine synthase
MEHLGLLGVGAAAAAVHAATGLWAWRLEESLSAEPAAVPVDAGLEPLDRRQVRLVTLALFLSGVGALLLETAALRSIGLTFGGSAHAYGTMVAAFVLGLSLGSALLGWWRPRRPLVGLAWSQLAVGVSVLLLTPALARLPWWAGQLRAATAPDGDYAQFLLGGFTLWAASPWARACGCCRPCSWARPSR